MRQLEQPFSKIHHNFEDIDILPTNLSEYYEFDGSLTTPPYKEITTWIVFPEFLEVSAKQVCSTISEFINSKFKYKKSKNIYFLWF